MRARYKEIVNGKL